MPSRPLPVLVAAVALLLALLGVPYAAPIGAAVALVAAFLNAVFDVCIGCLLYGVKVEKDLGRDLSPFGRLITAMGGRLAGIASLGAVAVMPGDMPPKGGEESILGLNTWITKIVTEKDPH